MSFEKNDFSYDYDCSEKQINDSNYLFYFAYQMSLKKYDDLMKHLSLMDLPQNFGWLEQLEYTFEKMMGPDPTMADWATNYVVEKPMKLYLMDWD